LELKIRQSLLDCLQLGQEDTFNRFDEVAPLVLVGAIELVRRTRKLGGGTAVIRDLAHVLTPTASFVYMDLAFCHYVLQYARRDAY